MSKDILKKGQKATNIAALTTVFFAIAKAVAGFLSGSIVLLADSIHSAADSFSTFAAFLGLKIAQKEPTEKFSYGFYKVENITALIISGLIFFAGGTIVKESVDKIFTEYDLKIPLIAVAVAVLDAIVLFFVGSYEMKAGKEINSQSLIADGKESRLHVLSSSVVVVGLISSWFNFPYLEGIAGIIISLFIFEAGFESAKDSILALLDVSPDKEVEEKIKKILRGISGLRDFDNLKLRKSGPFIFGEVEAKIGKKVNVNRASEISDSIEKTVKGKVKTVDSFTVSITPYQTKKQKVCIPLTKKEDISSHFGRAESFLFLEIEEGEVKRSYTKKNPYKEKEVRAGLNTALFVVKEKVDIVITKEMGPISLHTLRDNIVDVYNIEEDKVDKVIEKFNQGKLKPLKEATRTKF